MYNERDTNSLKMDKGILFLISGPSGVGKGTVIKELKKIFVGFVYPVSYTTREMRPGEKDGEVYHFVSKDVFEKDIESGEILEWARVHGDNYYGTSKKQIMSALKEGKVVVREVDVQGVISIKKVIPRENLVTIFLKAKNKKELMSRIKGRSKLPVDELKRRMQSAEKELRLADEFDYQVWSLENQIPKCVADVVQIFENSAAKAGIKLKRA